MCPLINTPCVFVFCLGGPGPLRLRAGVHLPRNQKHSALIIPHNNTTRSVELVTPIKNATNIPVTICARLFPSIPWVHTSFKTRLQHKQRTIVQSSGRLGFRRSSKKSWLGLALSTAVLHVSPGVRHRARPPLAAESVASGVDATLCAAACPPLDMPTHRLTA